jgi:hypothetical protein
MVFMESINSITNNYSGCFNRYHFQLKRISEYEKQILPFVNGLKSKELMQFVLEMIIVHRACSFEELLKNIIEAVCVKEQSKTKTYFLKNGSEEIKRKVNNGCSLGQLIAFAQSEVSFKKDAHKLERIFNWYIKFKPFLDQECKDYVLDMILIRNIVLHAGSLPNEKHAQQIKHPNAIKLTSEIDKGFGHNSHFFNLELTDFRFLSHLILSMSQILVHLAKSLNDISARATIGSQ